MLTLIRPAPGFSIVDPYLGGYLPAEGREVDLNDLYWHRLMMDGDIQVAAPEIAAHEAMPAMPHDEQRSDEE